MFGLLLGGDGTKKRNSIVLVIILIVLFAFNFFLSTLVVGNSIVSFEQQQQLSSSTQPPPPPQDDQSKESNEERPHLHSNKHDPRHRRLEYVHIPMTGAGSVIERIALQQANITWGANHFITTHQQQQGQKKDKLVNVPYWHYPPFYFFNINNNFDPQVTNPYGNNASLFTVVRNPYNRIVSEYLSYIHNNRENNVNDNTGTDGADDAALAMNEWLSTTLPLILRTLQMGVDGPRNETILSIIAASSSDAQETNQKQQYLMTITTTYTMDTSNQWNITHNQQGPNFKKGYYIYNGHYIPQYDYIYNGCSTSASGSNSKWAAAVAAQPVVDHVLHYENLHDEFTALLSEYGLDDKIQIPLNQPITDEEFKSAASALTVNDLSEANRRLIEAIYARDFAAFGYPILSPRPDVAAKEMAATAALRRRRIDAYYANMVRPGLEFVHIPKTGGTAVEKVAKKQNIIWGANHYTIRPPEQRRYMNVPYWHMPSHYYHQRLDHTAKDVLDEFDPHGPSPYENATALFTIVRNPYARVVSEYLFYHREVKHYTNVSKYNNAQQMNTWISNIMSNMAHVLQQRPNDDENDNKKSSSLSKNKYTIDTAGHWNKTLPWTNKAFIKHYFNSLGHFIPQYDYVYDMDLPVQFFVSGNSDEQEEQLPPPPKPVIQHVLHFETLHKEFATLMALYNLSHVVLSNPHANTTTSKTQQQEIKKPSIVGVANLTDSTKRLIEKVYARDFAAFGYEMI